MGAKAFEIKRKILGVALEKARLGAGKSLKDCAKAIGVSPAYLAQVEKGAKDLDLAQLEILARFLGIPTLALWEGEVEDSSQQKPFPPPEEAVKVRRKIIGLLLEKARVQAGKSLSEAAKFLGVSTRTLRAYEKGEKLVPLPHLEALADFYQVDKSFFLQQALFGPEEALDREVENFLKLPEEIRKFVANPSNILYLKSAIHLSKLSVEALREFAASLLDITL
jgi:transcriptional regulator with XRE-family HTH domain